jgi:hypothetical protein
LVCQRAHAFWVSGENPCGKSEELDGGLVGVKLFVVQFWSFVHHHDRLSDSHPFGCANSTPCAKFGDGDGDDDGNGNVGQSGNGNGNVHLNGNEPSDVAT